MDKINMKEKLIEKHTELQKALKEKMEYFRNLELELNKTKEAILILEGARQQIEELINLESGSKDESLKK